jgi:iron complex transport system substrate-binding protein
MLPRAKHLTFPILLLAAALAATAGVVAGCDGGGASPAPAVRADGKPTVASLVPAATDLILAMGAGDQLVAVSNYDYPREGTAGKPRVGDYLNTDWEQIRALKPRVMIRQYHPDRVPAGLKEKAESLGIRLVVLQIDGLEDVFRAYDVLGEAVGQPEKAATAKGKLRGQLEAVRQRTGGRQKVSVLVVRDDAGLAVIGPDTFLDELFPYVGGTNAAAKLNNRYPTIDREMLRALDPEVIVQLLPDAQPAKLEQAKRMWAEHPHLRAVRNGRVHQFTEWYVLIPAAHLGDLAEKLAGVLHIDAAGAATAPASPSTAGAP